VKGKERGGNIEKEKDNHKENKEEENDGFFSDDERSLIGDDEEVEVLGVKDMLECLHFDMQEMHGKTDGNFSYYCYHSCYYRL